MILSSHKLKNQKLERGEKMRYKITFKNQDVLTFDANADINFEQLDDKKPLTISGEKNSLWINLTEVIYMRKEVE